MPSFELNGTDLPERQMSTPGIVKTRQCIQKWWHGRRRGFESSCGKSLKGSAELFGRRIDAPIKSFFQNAEVERDYQLRYETRAQARLDVVTQIDGFYNRPRLPGRSLSDARKRRIEPHGRVAGCTSSRGIVTFDKLNDFAIANLSKYRGGRFILFGHGIYSSLRTQPRAQLLRREVRIALHPQSRLPRTEFLPFSSPSTAIASSFKGTPIASPPLASSA
ncbi:MAG: hypothetical protein ABI552_11795 [Casimicrobiaceae bacterium]